VSTNNTDNDIPAGFELSGFTGRYLEEGGPFYLKQESDSCAVGLRISEQHINYIDIAHGGVITTLADIALSLQPYQSETPHPTITTTSLTVNFMSGANLGDWLEARATIDRMSKRTAHVHGSIRCGERLIATASGIFGIYRGAST